MATIKTELTTNEFIKLYGDSQYVRGFSEEAIEAVLIHIEEIQGEGMDEGMDHDNDWTGFFMEAGEHTASSIVSDYSHEIDDLSSEIMDMVQGLESMPAELLERIENEEELASDDLLKELKEQLEALEGWNEGVADIIAESNDITKLDNGDYITFN